MAYRHESRKSLLSGDTGYATSSYPGGYRSREGLAPPLGAQPHARKMVFLPSTPWTITFLVTVLVQGAAVLACEA